VYVEYSNEVWNGDFKAYRQNKAITAATTQPALTGAGEQLFDGNPLSNVEYASWRRVARRGIEIKHLLGHNPSVRLVLPVQINRAPPGQMARIMLEYVERFHGPPREYFYGVAGAPYFKADRALMQCGDLTVDQVCQSLLDNAELCATSAGQLATTELCKKYGLVSLGYELGLDLWQFGVAVQIKAAAQYDPRTALAVERYLDAWFAAGGQQGFYLQSHGGYSKNGYWGLMEDLFKPDTPKSQAARRVAERLQAGGRGLSD
jgi:hypothetical protein